MIRKDNKNPAESREQQGVQFARHRLSTLRSVLVCVLALSGCAHEPTKHAPPLAASAAPKSPWDRIVMIGASASAGYTESEPFGGNLTRRYQLNRYLDAALLAPHAPIVNLASAFFFVRPEAAGRHEMNRALAVRPTLVVALDFLFWYCYGDGDADAERLERFRKGLKLLDEVPCPLIVGDIPDASGASKEMLRPDQIPSPTALSEANRLLREWAADRPGVTIVPLARFMRRSMAVQALTVHGKTFPDGENRNLLQPDGLHPTALGCSVLALSIWDAFTNGKPSASTDVRWDFQEVLRSGLGRTKAPAPVGGK